MYVFMYDVVHDNGYFFHIRDKNVNLILAKQPIINFLSDKYFFWQDNGLLVLLKTHLRLTNIAFCTNHDFVQLVT